ncbi:MAG TPA: fumarylacetoacetate hydrolase family protein [Candidatus Sulfotelmatobacter sp.]|nr:fumarylacetoacetate hydrolase family protein [Candidatus Sulfotelmatobacter sp.]
MRIVRFQVGPRTAYGVWEGEAVREIRGSIFGDFTIEQVTHRIGNLRLLAPVEPTKILCVGLNFRDHIEEIGFPTPSHPAHFLKPLTTLIGPEESIVIPRVAKQVDYEGEPAAVIKRTIKDASLEEASAAILGYTCLNDVTERPLSTEHGQLTRSKGFDTFAPVGPCIATDVDPAALVLRTHLNGRLMQEAKLADMIFSIPFLVQYLSQCMTLFPGDIVSAGTPRGVAAMKPGDVVEVSIDGIGTLRNPVCSA